MELCDQVKLSNLVKQYSQFISFPIKLYSPKKEPIKVIDEDATRRKQAAADKKALEKAEESKPVSQADPEVCTCRDQIKPWRQVQRFCWNTAENGEIRPKNMFSSFFLVFAKKKNATPPVLSSPQNVIFTTFTTMFPKSEPCAHVSPRG